MSNYIKLATGEYPLHQGDIRLEYPDMGEKFVLPDSYAEVMNTPEPEYDISTQRVEELQPELINGTWQRKWAIRAATQEEIDMANSWKGPNNA